ncbi:MAG: MFS transporter [Candidatus Coatesbacteria bacterium]|nr:MFS transporter [Candidatus Coatesbacteria bacterium]
MTSKPAASPTEAPRGPRRWLILAAVVLVQLCVGGIYAWSAIAKPLTADYGLMEWQGQLIFGLNIAVFALTMLFAGRLLDRRGPTLPVTIGGLLFAAGLLIASLSGGRFIWLLLGYGVVAGAGIGFVYLCPIATAGRWFPKRKGLVTGVAVAGFGGGAILLSTVIETLLAHGLGPLQIFQWVGLAYGALIIVCAFILANPPGAKLAVKTAELPRVGRDPRFWRFFGAMFAGTFSGLLVIGNLKLIGLDGGAGELIAAGAVGALAVGNSAGRIAWGLIADRFGRHPASVLSLILLAASILLLLPAAGWGWWFLIVAALVGFNFGAAMVLYATQTQDTFGAQNFGRVYAFVSLAYGLSGTTGPFIGGLIFDLTAGYGAAVLVAAGVAVVGAVFYMLMEPAVGAHENMGQSERA